MSSTAHSNECIQAASIQSGQPSPCSGLVISNDQAKECLKCAKVTVPKLKELLAGCEQKVATLQDLNKRLQAAATEAIESESTTYELNTVVLVAVSALAVGVSAGMLSVTLGN